MVFQCPCGSGARQRCPRGERPQRRAILVDAPVSSMKTSLSGSRAPCTADQDCRRCSTSVRCCSLACAVFFKRDAASLEEAPHRALRDPQPVHPLQMSRNLRQRHVRGLFDQRQDPPAVHLNPLRAPVAPSPRRPDTTIRIFSSAEYCLRVLRRISRTALSAGSFLLMDCCLIFVPFGHYDEPEILRYPITSICPISADGEQVIAVSDAGTIQRCDGWKEPRKPFRVFVTKADLVPGKVGQELERHRKGASLVNMQPTGEYGLWSVEAQEVARVAEYLAARHVDRAGASSPAARRAAPNHRRKPFRDKSIAAKDAAEAVCKHCGAKDITARSGIYGYYWRCGACGKNTVCRRFARRAGPKGGEAMGYGFARKGRSISATARLVEFPRGFGTNHEKHPRQSGL